MSEWLKPAEPMSEARCVILLRYLLQHRYVWSHDDCAML